MAYRSGPFPIIKHDPLSGAFAPCAAVTQMSVEYMNSMAMDDLFIGEFLHQISRSSNIQPGMGASLWDFLGFVKAHAVLIFLVCRASDKGGESSHLPSLGESVL